MKPRLSLAESLRTVRKECGLTLAELASRTGLPRTTLSKVENGKASLTYEKLVQVGEGLGVDIARLFDAKGHNPEASRSAQWVEACSSADRHHKRISRLHGPSWRKAQVP